MAESNVIQFPGTRTAKADADSNVKCLHPKAKKQAPKKAPDFRKMMALDLSDVAETADSIQEAVPFLAPGMCQKLTADLAEVRMRLQDIYARVSKYIPNDKEPA